VSAETRRLFISVDPPAEAVAHLGAAVDTLEVSRANAPGRSTRLAARELWHITLAFLGDVRVDRVDRAAGAVERAVATVEGPITVSLCGGGTFRGRGGQTVLWGGLAGDLPALRRLAQAVRQELRRSRLPYDAKPLRPHLTLARPGDRVTPDLIAADVATLSAYVGPEWTVDAVHVVESHLGPKPVHTRLASVPLASRP
jgi:2'-5' RNA ligase